MDGSALVQVSSSPLVSFEGSLKPPANKTNRRAIETLVEFRLHKRKATMYPPPIVYLLADREVVMSLDSRHVQKLLVTKLPIWIAFNKERVTRVAENSQ